MPGHSKEVHSRKGRILDYVGFQEERGTVALQATAHSAQLPTRQGDEK